MPESVNFKHKISRQRPYGKAEPGLRASDGNLNAVLDQLESDRGRIINSAAVRRLQQKTFRRAKEPGPLQRTPKTKASESMCLPKVTCPRLRRSSFRGLVPTKHRRRLQQKTFRSAPPQGRLQITPSRLLANGPESAGLLYRT